MWRRSVATPNKPMPARAKKMRAKARPWLVLPPAKEATALTMAAKVAGVAQGVPVWAVWNRKMGTHGRKVAHPTTAATSESRAPRLQSGRPRHAVQANQSSTVATR